ncbi:MAG: immunogenic protein [Clostridia bacterium]|nr:immunogenic protein [Clostridia bacterium]
MKKIIIVLLCIMMILTASACGNNSSVKSIVKGNMKTYYEMIDGSFMCDDYKYRYRLEINGRMPNAAVDSTFVYLSNIEEIHFERAYMAAGISSNTDDYFQPEDAVLVEMK